MLLQHLAEIEIGGLLQERHQLFKAGRKLGRSASNRKAMLRNMVTSLIEHGRITTTDAKATEVRRYA